MDLAGRQTITSSNGRPLMQPASRPIGTSRYILHRGKSKRLAMPIGSVHSKEQEIFLRHFSWSLVWRCRLKMTFLRFIMQPTAISGDSKRRRLAETSMRFASPLSRSQVIWTSGFIAQQQRVSSMSLVCGPQKSQSKNNGSLLMRQRRPTTSNQLALQVWKQGTIAWRSTVLMGLPTSIRSTGACLRIPLNQTVMSLMI